MSSGKCQCEGKRVTLLEGLLREVELALALASGVNIGLLVRT